MPHKHLSPELKLRTKSMIELFLIFYDDDLTFFIPFEDLLAMILGSEEGFDGVYSSSSDNILTVFALFISSTILLF